MGYRSGLAGNCPGLRFTGPGLSIIFGIDFSPWVIILTGPGWNTIEGWSVYPTFLRLPNFCVYPTFLRRPNEPMAQRANEPMSQPGLVQPLPKQPTVG